MGPLDYQRWVPFRNDSGEEIPAFAILRLTGAAMLGASTNTSTDGRIYYTVIKPTGFGATSDHAFNGANVVPIGGYGMCTQDGPCLALFGVSDPLPNSLHTGVVGPHSGEWSVSKGGIGWRCRAITDTTNSLCIVVGEPNQAVVGFITGSMALFFAHSIFGNETTNAVQTLAMMGYTATSGSQTVEFRGDSATINWDDSDADVQTALEGLGSIGSGQVSVSGGNLPDDVLTIEFTGTLASQHVELPEVTGGAGFSSTKGDIIAKNHFVPLTVEAGAKGLELTTGRVFPAWNGIAQLLPTQRVVAMMIGGSLELVSVQKFLLNLDDTVTDSHISGVGTTLYNSAARGVALRISGSTEAIDTTP